MNNIDLKNTIENLNEKLKNLIRKNEQNNILIGKLEDEINNLRNEKNIFLNDNEALKNEYKKIISKNIKLDNLINNLKTLIEKQKIQINELKHTSHHN